MYLGRTLFIAGFLYFAVHFITGYYYCVDNFCPGDREADWVYEYTDDDGRHMIVVDGKPLDKKTWEKDRGIEKFKVENK
jgi:hypothetical protein